jgi:hypothetical protein
VPNVYLFGTFSTKKPTLTGAHGTVSRLPAAAGKERRLGGKGHPVARNAPGGLVRPKKRHSTRHSNRNISKLE